jgi:hypothetical protein
LGTLSQIVAALTVAFNEDSMPRRPGPGEKDVDLEMLCPVSDVRLPLLRLGQEAVMDPPFDAELLKTREGDRISIESADHGRTLLWQGNSD